MLAADTDQDVTVDYQYDSAGRLVTMTAYNAKGSGNGVTPEATKYLYTSTINASWQTGVVYPDSTRHALAGLTTGVWTITTDTATTPRPPTTGWAAPRARPTSGAWCIPTSTTRPAGSRRDAVDLRANAAGRRGRYGPGHRHHLRRHGPRAERHQLRQTTARLPARRQPGRDTPTTAGAISSANSRPTTVSVDTATRLSVQYDLRRRGVGGVAAYVRLADVIYPNGRGSNRLQLRGGVDNIMSRLSSISDSTGTLDAAYKYLGLGTDRRRGLRRVADEAHLSRLLRQRHRPGPLRPRRRSALGAITATTQPCWTSTPTPTTGLATSQRANVLNDGHARLGRDLHYDALDRLTEWSVGGGSQQETWSLDSLGNNLSAGTYNASQRGDAHRGSSGYDAAGNMTTLSSGDTAVYDAWNRLTEVDQRLDRSLQKNEYDGTNRRIQIFSSFSGSTPPRCRTITIPASRSSRAT